MAAPEVCDRCREPLLVFRHRAKALVRGEVRVVKLESGRSGAFCRTCVPHVVEEAERFDSDTFIADRHR